MWKLNNSDRTHLALLDSATKKVNQHWARTGTCMDDLLGALADASIGSDINAAWRRVDSVETGLLHWWYYVQLVPASGRASSNNISASKK